MVQKVITDRIPRIIAAPRNSGERIIFIILEDNGIAGMFHFRIRQCPFENFWIKNAPSKERSAYDDQDTLTRQLMPFFCEQHSSLRCPAGREVGLIDWGGLAEVPLRRGFLFC